MGVTIDKSRGSTVVEGVFIKSVAKEKSADLAQSTSGGLRPGRENILVGIMRLIGTIFMYLRCRTLYEMGFA